MLRNERSIYDVECSQKLFLVRTHVILTKLVDYQGIFHLPWLRQYNLSIDVTNTTAEKNIRYISVRDYNLWKKCPFGAHAVNGNVSSLVEFWYIEILLPD